MIKREHLPRYTKECNTLARYLRQQRQTILLRLDKEKAIRALTDLAKDYLEDTELAVQREVLATLSEAAVLLAETSYYNSKNADDFNLYCEKFEQLAEEVLRSSLQSQDRLLQRQLAIILHQRYRYESQKHLDVLPIDAQLNGKQGVDTVEALQSHPINHELQGFNRLAWSIIERLPSNCDQIIDEIILRTLQITGDIHCSHQQLDAAIQCYQTALDKVKSSENINLFTIRCTITLDLAYIYLSLRADFITAEPLYRTLHHAMKNRTYQSAKLRMIEAKSLSSYYFCLKNLQDAGYSVDYGYDEQWSSKALNRLFEENIEKPQALVSENRHSDAIKILQTFIEKHIYSSHYFVRYYCIMAADLLVYYLAQQGQFQQAVDFGEKYAKHWQGEGYSLNELKELASLQFNLALSYSELEKHDQEISAYYQLIERYQDFTSDDIIRYKLVRSYTNLAYELEQKGNINEALKYYRYSAHNLDDSIERNVMEAMRGVFGLVKLLQREQRFDEELQNIDTAFDTVTEQTEELMTTAEFYELYCELAISRVICLYELGEKNKATQAYHDAQQCLQQDILSPSVAKRLKIKLQEVAKRMSLWQRLRMLFQRIVHYFNK